MVFLHVHPALVETLLRNPRADDLGEAVDVGRDDAQVLFERRAHLARPRLGAAEGIGERFRTTPFGAEALGDHERIARRGADADDRDLD